MDHYLGSIDRQCNLGFGELFVKLDRIGSDVLIQTFCGSLLLKHKVMNPYMGDIDYDSDLNLNGRRLF